jgi:2-polyprenyl-3-methyl-5-hydroxy-6-metoxy-1,4-benzoquinol methylase
LTRAWPDNLACAIGTSGRVLAIDLNPAVAALAAEHASHAGVAEMVTVRSGDAAEVFTDGAFDAIWTSDVVWPGNFDDPAAIVARMAQAVRPGGVVALFYSNYYQSLFLPGRSRLQRLLFAASRTRPCARIWSRPSGPSYASPSPSAARRPG